MNPVDIMVVRQPESKTVDILNVPIDNLTLIDLLDKLKYGGVVFTPNVDHIIKLQKDESFYQIYSQADYRVCDSQMVMLASRFLGSPLKEKISGSDLFPAFYNYYSKDKNTKIFLLGGSEGAAKMAQQKINAKIGRDIVVDSYCPPFGFEKDPIECDKIINLINDSGATVLAVGVGAPKQEKWIYKHKNSLKSIKTFFAVGATIEFEAEYVFRAPKWISLAGLEWLYRLVQEPKRLWKRYLLEDTSFFVLIVLQKLNLLLKNR
jgi:N-acetylglucosaminyldiphosphoundecaprenol N-acetyl-beta-D-mannosaminyltransferase